MSKKITFEYEKTKFTLEFNRRTVKDAEKRGLNLDNMDNMPVTQILELVYSAFQMHHGGITRDLTEQIYDSISNKQGLIVELAKMYNDTVISLTDEGSKGNVVWSMS